MSLRNSVRGHIDSETERKRERECVSVRERRGEGVLILIISPLVYKNNILKMKNFIFNVNK